MILLIYSPHVDSFDFRKNLARVFSSKYSRPFVFFIRKDHHLTMQLSYVESQRACIILDDTVDKLEILGVMAPESTEIKDELSQLVSDEISRIIEEQRRLQARYEELIMQRSQLKNVTNKSKYKEIQTELEEVATALRYATKVLCRNLKENPNVAENLEKVRIKSYRWFQTHIKYRYKRKEKLYKKSFVISRMN
jgi:hypothetical protein